MTNYSLKPTDENALGLLKTDPIGRNKYIRRFIQMLTRMEDNCYTVALNGDWGSGKTFFVKQIKMILDAYNPQSNMDEEQRKAVQQCYRDNSCPDSYATVYYDAWAFDNHDDPILSLVYTTLKSGCGEEPEGKGNSLIKAAVRVIDVIKGTNLTEIYGAFKNQQPEKLTAEIEKTEDLKDSIRAFIDTLIQEKGNRLIIFIDELDRCKPDYAIRLLERIKHYFDDERITFVFSVNLTQLQWTVKGYYGSSFDATGYLEKFFDFFFTVPRVDSVRFLWNSMNLDTDSVTGQMCVAIIKQFNFSMRQMERYIRVMKIIEMGDACENARSRRDKATAFVGEFVIPLLIGLQMHDLDMYHNFRIGKDPTPLVNILASIDAPECKFLLCGEETFVADKNMSPMPGGTHVIKKDRVIEVYNAIFSKTGGVDVGQMTFSDRTREYLYEMESILIPDGNFDFEYLNNRRSQTRFTKRAWDFLL